MIHRLILQDIENSLFKGRVIIVYGARQVGKTTLCREIVKNLPKQVYMSCDDPEVQKALNDRSARQMLMYLGDAEVLILDEAQKLSSPGLTIKILHDAYPKIQIIASGSSSFELASSIQEPLTGRKIEFHLFPFLLDELCNNFGFRDVASTLENRIIYGNYPDIVLAPTIRESELRLSELTQSYLFKDILMLDKIKNSEKLEKMAIALALQIGNEVSYNELASLIGLDKNTIQRYLQILEQAFIVFRINPYSSNKRSGLKKNRKIYFWDTGIRNMLIRNFNEMDRRTDTGALWENFILSERIKLLRTKRDLRNSWFWRAAKPATGEIDYIEEINQTLRAYEIKWRKTKAHIPKAFIDQYHEMLQGKLKIVNNGNWFYFVSQS